MEDQEFYNSIMNEADIEEDKKLAEANRVNSDLVNELLKTEGFVWVKGFLHDYHENECYDKITISDKPKGEKQSNYWGAINGVFVEQYSDFEDSYWGFIYFPIKDGRYLKCRFAC